jgi:hypothetical protein
MTATQSSSATEARWIASSMSCPEASWKYPQRVEVQLDVKNKFDFSFVEWTSKYIIFNGVLEIHLLNTETLEEIGDARFASRLEVLLMDDTSTDDIRNAPEVRESLTEFCVSITVGYLRTLVIQSSSLSGAEFQIILPPISLALIGDVNQIDY